MKNKVETSDTPTVAGALRLQPGAEARFLEELEAKLLQLQVHLGHAKAVLFNTGKYNEMEMRGRRQMAHEHIERAQAIVASLQLPF